MKVVLVGAGMIPIPPPDYGAVEKHVWNLSRALEARGHEVRIVNRVFGDASRDEYRFALWARREVAREPYDVLHVHTPGVATVFSALGPRRFVYTTHSRHWAGVEGIGPRIGHFLEHRAVRNATEAIAVSPFVAGLAPRTCHVVPNGVDPAVYAPRWDARNGRRVVGIGEVAPHKRWHLAAAACAAAGVDFAVAGPIRDVVYAKVVEDAGHGKANLLGPVAEPDLAALVGEADVLLHPSISESFGMAVVEGMSAGLPVICSDFLSFLVRHEKEGYLVPTKGTDEARIAAIHEKLRALLDDGKLRRALGEAARTRAVANYSWESVAEKVERVYAVAAP